MRGIHSKFGKKSFGMVLLFLNFYIACTWMYEEHSGGVCVFVYFCVCASVYRLIDAQRAARSNQAVSVAAKGAPAANDRPPIF